MLIAQSEELISKASVNLALEEILELNGKVSSLKKLKVPGAGYLYPVFLRFGLIRRKRMDSCQYELDGRMILESNHPMHNGLTVKKSAVWSVATSSNRNHPIRL